MNSHLYGAVIGATMLLYSSAHGFAEDTLKVAVGQPGSWGTAIAELGQRQGIFKKHDLVLDITYTAGGGETIQPVISGAVDIGVGIGTAGAISAYTKGAPVRIIGNSMAGARDLMWFVKADSPIKSMKDVEGHTFAFGSKGSSTEIVGRALLDQFGVKATMVPTGSYIATMTMTMSDQIDVGWTAPPVVFDPLAKGEIRILATGDDSEKHRNQTVRVIAANADALTNKADAMRRFYAAYKETIDWLYSDEKALVTMGEIIKQGEEKTKKTLEVYPKETIDISRVVGLEGSVADGIQYKLLSAPLSAEQLKEVYVKLD